MSVGAIVKDGVIQETASQSSVSKSTTTAEQNGMDKDAFLQLLVAQMKYQDPLEPTSNTEYISQYATFSQVEMMQNMSATMELSRASSMVGQLVTIETTNSAGETSQVQGTVEYVTFENNKAYVSIDGTLYSADDVVAVVDNTYQTAYDLAVSFISAMDKLPVLGELTLDDAETIESLRSGFNSMTSYQQSFIADEYVEKLQEYVDRIAVLEEQAQAENNTTETEDETAEETGSVEEAAGTGETESDVQEDAAEETEVDAGTGEEV